MEFYSTNNKNSRKTAREAVIKGLPHDNGLFMPVTIPKLAENSIDNLQNLSLVEIAELVLYPYFTADIPAEKFTEILTRTFSFPIPLVQVTDQMYSLELFHGPTMAFKDVGAGFLSGCLSYFFENLDQKSTVLVATSGDTGSAVANGFHKSRNIDVVILFPKGKISEIQKQQMTTLGENITAIEIDGAFDDCQKLVKTAFLDQDLSNSINLTSANSINVARFLAQSVYYFHAVAQLNGVSDAVFSVPSGNFGNLTAGVFARSMGLPINHFVASTNVNNIVPRYLKTGKFVPRVSIPTISNAMDVGNPSNFARILDHFDYDLVSVREEISGSSYDDDQTRAAIAEVYKEYGYILDPHGAVAFLGLRDYLSRQNGTGVFLETAHPFKFGDVVTDAIGKELDPPEQFINSEKRDAVSIPMKADFDQLKNFLLS